MCHDKRSGDFTPKGRVSSEWLTIARGQEEIPALLASSQSPGTGSVLILHDIYGANDFYQCLAVRLADAGYRTLLPDLFFRQGPLPEQTMEHARARGSKLDQLVAMEDIRAVMEWLQADDAVASIGVVGFCMGGTLALLAAAREPIPASSVSYYGFPAGRQGWPLRPMGEASTVQAPLLGLWGDQDAGVGMDNVETYRSELVDAGRKHEFVVYPGLPHGFLTFDPESPHYAEAVDSWQRTLGFFQSTLT